MNLKELRKYKGFTQETAAKALEIPVRTYKRYENEKSYENTFKYNVGQADWITSNVDTTKILDSGALQFNTEFATSYYFFKNSTNKPSRNVSVWDYPEFRNVVLEAFPWDAVRGNAMVPATTFVYPIGNYPTVEGFNYTDLEKFVANVVSYNEIESNVELQSVGMVTA